MRADFRRFYSLDIDAGEASPSQTWDLIRFLPPEAAYWRVLDPAREWSTEAHLLASIYDALAAANWQRSGGKGKRPKPIERPGMKSDKDVLRLDRFNSAAEFDAWREAQLNKH